MSPGGRNESEERHKALKVICERFRVKSGSPPGAGPMCEVRPSPRRRPLRPSVQATCSAINKKGFSRPASEDVAGRPPGTRAVLFRRNGGEFPGRVSPVPIIPDICERLRRLSAKSLRDSRVRSLSEAIICVAAEDDEVKRKDGPDRVYLGIFFFLFGRPWICITAAGRSRGELRPPGGVVPGRRGKVRHPEWHPSKVKLGSHPYL